jgi:hypothetical protein
MQTNTKKILSILLGSLITLSATTSAFAVDRTCDEKQVYAAVMKSGENDLSAPYNKGDVIGSQDGGHATGIKGQCKMTLFFNMGIPNAEVLYNIDVPLSKVKVHLASTDKEHQAELKRSMSAMGDEGDVAPKACKQVIFPKGSISSSVNGIVAGFTKDQETPAPSECYTITSGDNQTANITVTSTNSNSSAEVVNTSNNKILSRDGGNDKLEFLTKKTTYQITISQFMPTSPDDDNYTLFVEVK